MTGDLLALADAFHDARISAVMRSALARPLPGGSGPSEAMRFFGADYLAVRALIDPVTAAVDDMLPGFRQWLDTTGFAHDRYMMTALLALADKLEAMRSLPPKYAIPRGLDRPLVLT